MAFDPADEFRKSPPSSISDGGWTTALDGLDLLRVTIIANLVTSIMLKLVGAAGRGMVGPLLEVIASVIFAVMTVVALGRWRSVPRETRGKGLADLGWVGAIIGLAGVLLMVVLIVVMLGGRASTARSLEPFIVLVALVSVGGSLLQIVGFLLSARAVALYLERGDIAGRAVMCLVLGALTVGVALAFQLGGGKRSAIVFLLVLLALAIGALVTFLMTVSGLQTAIRERPSVADAFS